MHSEILYKCEKPSRYIGGEYLSFNKDFNEASVKIAFAFPDKYEIGISNFGHKILYNLVNEQENFMADRIYAPENDFRELLDEPLWALDSKKPLKEFDFIGFALQYELSYTTVLKMLEMAQIPVLSKDRDDTHPIITAGGPCAYNPCPLSKFVDLFLIGDGEDLVLEMMEKYEELKGQPRATIIKELSKLEGMYSPLFPKKVKKRVSQLDYDKAPVKSPIPHFVSVHDRATVEIRRGCSRLCRFCQSAHTNLPIRERKGEDVISLVKDYVKNTGYDEYSLLSLSSNDHSEIEDIIEKLNLHFKGTDVNVSLPSQRADNFSIKLANLMQEVKKSAVTLAPEAGTQRMRDIIKKGLTQEQIINATLACVKCGWKKIKYYFMIGLPFEEQSDLDGMIELLNSVNGALRNEGLKYPQITCSVSIFVPKPFTPFQRCKQDALDVVDEKIAYLRSKCPKNVKLNFHNPKVSQIEAFLTRGDETVADFIYEMYKKGEYLASWSENIDFSAYSEIAHKHATMELQGELPWNMIDINLDDKFFENEYQKALDIAKNS